MARRDIIVVGASTGGVEALTQMVGGLPASFPASVFIVCHFPPGEWSVLPEILSRSGHLLATHAIDGEPFFPAHIYVAPPDRHLLLTPDGRTELTRAARENNHRPAVDPLFRSAARYYDSRVIGVILTGALSDGAAGLMAVRAAGGVAVVQDPRDAMVATMPQSASQIAGADYIIPLADLARVLVELVRKSLADPAGAKTMNSLPPDPMERAEQIVEETMSSQARGERHGEVSMFVCPECGGTLWQLDQPEILQFRCHVGHAYNAETLLTEQTDALEAALWTAVRTFREKAVLSQQLANREDKKGNQESAERFREQSAQAARYASLIIEHVLQNENAGDTAQEGNPK